MSRPTGPDPILVASAAHVFVESLDAPMLGDDDAHHLGRVLRLRAGETVTVSDGVGGWRECVFAGGSLLDPVGEINREPEPPHRVAIGFGIPKGDRPEWIVQKLTEIGADRIIPLLTDRGVVRWSGDRDARNLERLRRVAREASCQSRRTWLPVVDDVASAFEVMSGAGVAAATMDGAPLGVDVTTILVGPEGGWTPRELGVSTATVGLGDTVLRVETAALVACTLLVQRRNR
jgi:16S rRNA (uracil1498-N3)-methyltransferase